jgi:MFS family permease
MVQICWGISMGANGPIIFSYLGDLFGIHYRGRFFSIFATFLYFIKGGSDAISGIIGTVLNSWTAPSLIMAIGGIIALIIFIFSVKDPKLAQIEPEFEEKIAAGGVYNYRIRFKDLKMILTQRTNFLFLIQGIFGSIGVVIVNRYIIYWFTSNLYGGMNMNSIAATILLGFGAILGAVIGINFAGYYTDRQFKQGRLDKMLYFSILCLFGQIIGYGVLIFLPQYPTTIGQAATNPFTVLNDFPVFWQFIIIFNVCILFSTGIGPVVGMARTHINLPENRGTVTALYDTTNNIGSAIGIAIGVLFISIFDSYRITLFVGALFWIVSGIIWIGMTKTINQDYKEIRKIMQERAQSDS